MSGILILSATEIEVSGFLNEFPGLPGEKLASGSLFYAGPGWHCLITGPGVFNTAMGLGAYLEHHTPDLILDTGIAGAFGPAGLAVGDIGIADREQYLHTGVGNESSDLTPLPFDLIPGRLESCSGIYSLDPSLVALWKTRMERKLADGRTRIAQGPFLTVSAITRGQDSALLRHDRFGVIMESMEGAAAAHVAGCCGIPMVEIRAASNMAGERNKDHWDFDSACDGVKKICLAVCS